MLQVKLCCYGSYLNVEGDQMLKIFLTDLECYNEGSLVGKWIELPMKSYELRATFEEVFTEGEAISGDEDHEEYIITDYEWVDIALFPIDEHHNICKLNLQLKRLKDKYHHQIKAVSFLLYQGIAQDIDEALEKADDVVVYEDQTLEDLIYDLIHECYEVDALPPIIYNHIDYDAIARDLEYEGRYYKVGNDVYEYTD